MGLANADYTTTSVAFRGGYHRPIIIVGIPSKNGDEDVGITISDVGDTEFHLTAQLPDDCEASKTADHSTEEFAWMIVEDGGVGDLKAGTVQSPCSGGRLCTPENGCPSCDHSTGFDWVHVDTPGFPSAGRGCRPPGVCRPPAPVVISTIQGPPTGGDFAKTRQKNVEDSGFDVRVEEDGTDMGHNTELIGWIAVAVGTGELGSSVYEALVTPDAVTHNPYDVSFSVSPSLELLFGSMHSFDGPDPSHLRSTAMTGTGCTIFVEEEGCDERAHTTETVGILALSLPGEAGGSGGGGGGSGSGCTDADLTDLGTPFDTLSESGQQPKGGGNHDIAVIADNDDEAFGSQDSSKQYDTYIGGGGNENEFIGYTFTSPVVVKGITLKEGKHFWDGGYWETGPDVEVQKGKMAGSPGYWAPATGVSVSPNLPSEAEHDFDVAQSKSFQTFEYTFDAVETTGVRLNGQAGGQDHFVSVAEMRIHGLQGHDCAAAPAPPPPPAPHHPPPPPPPPSGSPHGYDRGPPSYVECDDGKPSDAAPSLLLQPERTIRAVHRTWEHRGISFSFFGGGEGQSQPAGGGGGGGDAAPDPCADNRCQNDGQCVARSDGHSAGGYTCQCAGGWQGAHCNMCPGGSVGGRCNSAAPPPPPPPSASDHCSYHLFHANPKSWVEAEADCVRAGGHLASIHSAEQNAQIDALLEGTGFRAWIGFNDRDAEVGCADGRHQDQLADSFVWSDGSQVDFQSWASGEPNDWQGGSANCDGTGNEDCVSANDESFQGLWADNACNGAKPYICANGLCGPPAPPPRRPGPPPPPVRLPPAPPGTPPPPCPRMWCRTPTGACAVCNDFDRDGDGSIDQFHPPTLPPVQDCGSEMSTVFSQISDVCCDAAGADCSNAAPDTCGEPCQDIVLDFWDRCEDFITSMGLGFTQLDEFVVVCRRDRADGGVSAAATDALDSLAAGQSGLYSCSYTELTGIALQCAGVSPPSAGNAAAFCTSPCASVLLPFANQCSAQMQMVGSTSSTSTQTHSRRMTRACLCCRH